MSIITLSCGDTNGIGPEIALKVIQKMLLTTNYGFYLFCPSNVFHYHYSRLKLNFNYAIVQSENVSVNSTKKATIVNTGDVEIIHGIPTKESGTAAYNSIMGALQLLTQQDNDGILVTSPISKYAFKLADINFAGHTELLAEYFKISNFGMVFISEYFNTILATIHEPIKAIPALITKKLIREKIDLAIKVCKDDLGIGAPKISILGLNPHAGENGKIGEEEIKIIEPVVKEYDDNVNGPFVPDAFFARKKYKECDAVVGLYHDQVLIPLKLLTANSGVNFTAGLPIVRTSPDHGTAYDIAGKGIADSGSIELAIKKALEIYEFRTQR